MKKILILLSSICLMIVGIVISTSRDVNEIFAYNEIISQESKQYYEYIENEDGTLTTNELSRFDYEISVEVEKLKREEKTAYKQQQGDRNPWPPFEIYPNIILSGVNYGGSTTGSVTVTYQYATNAYYSVGTSSYTSFSSGTVFSAVGNYTIYCTNQYGSAYAYFSIVTLTGSGSAVNDKHLPYYYETVTTAITTAKSWDYMQVVTTCDWDILIGDASRSTNVIYSYCNNIDFDNNYTHTSTISYNYDYEDDIYDSNFIYQYTDYGNTGTVTTILDWSSPSSANAHSDNYGNTNYAVLTLEKNLPMLTDYDLQDEVSRLVRRYTAATFVLTTYYELDDGYSTIGTYSDFPTNQYNQKILHAGGGNIVGNTNLTVLTVLSAICTIFSIAASAIGFSFSSLFIGIIGAVLTFADNEQRDSNTLSLSQSFSNLLNYGARIEAVACVDVS